MRILCASTQGAGHFNPLVPFLEAFQRMGHDVLVVGPPALDAKSYPFRPGASPPEEILGPVWAAMGSIPPGQGDVVVVGTDLRAAERRGHAADRAGGDRGVAAGSGAAGGGRIRLGGRC